MATKQRGLLRKQRKNRNKGKVVDGAAKTAAAWGGLCNKDLKAKPGPVERASLDKKGRTGQGRLGPTCAYSVLHLQVVVVHLHAAIAGWGGGAGSRRADLRPNKARCQIRVWQETLAWEALIVRDLPTLVCSSGTH